MLISKKATSELRRRMNFSKETFCSGLYLSARWMAVTDASADSVNLIILPDRETAEYCSADLYNLTEGDCVFFLPESGKNVERSVYKSSLSVQRTSAIGKLLTPSKEKIFIVTYPEALEEKIPSARNIKEAVLNISQGDEISFGELKEKLFDAGFERVDFVSSPGQFAIRGSVIDIFSYSLEHPYRLSFFGNEIEKINSFDCNTQLSREKLKTAEKLGRRTFDQ